MKKTTKKMLISLVGASMLTACLPMNSAAADGIGYVRVSVRIEGINKCFCDKDVYYPAKGNDVSASDVLEFADRIDDGFEITGLSDGYITAVNGDTAASFGGWDGWLYRVNGIEPSVTAAEFGISDGDELVLFYGDPYGVGIQFPEMTADGNTLTFSSSDISYDPEWNPITTVNPVVGMTVYCDGETYLTDENGSVTVKNPDSGDIFYEKYSDSGIPLVLRSEPVRTVGDVNCDTVIDAKDASEILKAYADLGTGAGTLISVSADTDGSGCIDAVDASNVLAYYAAASTSTEKFTFEEFMAEKNK